jgi:hypothetical protein
MAGTGDDGDDDPDSIRPSLVTPVTTTYVYTVKSHPPEQTQGPSCKAAAPPGKPKGALK